MHTAGERPIWDELTTVVADEGDLAVRIQTTRMGRPLYSREIGVFQEGRFKRHLRAWLDSDAGTITIRPFDYKALKALLDKSEEVIRQDAQAREDEWQRQRSVRPSPTEDDARTRRRRLDQSKRRGRRGDRGM